MIQAGPTLVALKLAFIYILIFFTGPVATHAVAQAALHAGIDPDLTEDRRTARKADTAPTRPVATVVDPSAALPPSDTTE
ncbi:MAG: monovalent cation/H(+) antiporter subunit G [Pseudomonadota bacterium]